MEANLVEEFLEAESDEEKFVSQQAKIKWLKEGDRNTSYFHKVLKGRSHRNKVFSLSDVHGVRYEGDQISNLFLNHFKEFLGTSHVIQSIDEMDELFVTKLSTEEADGMIRIVTCDEIKKALFDIDDSKAPGPDGFTADFFKKAWGVIENEFCCAIKEFLYSGRLLGEINATIVSLIPKVATPSKVTEFRPIACCNVIYKCISIVITNRIKPVLGHLVSNNQSSFIPGRQIQDNILLT